MENLENIRESFREMGMKAKRASRLLACRKEEEKNRYLAAMAEALEKNIPSILEANLQDMAKGREKGLSDAMLDRLKLDETRVLAMAKGLRHVMTLPDPAGKALSEYVREDGLKIVKTSVPIGVIGVIYESRPNVTVDTAGLCLKAGNCVILRGGSEAFSSNKILASLLVKAGEEAGMPEGAVQFVETTSHDAVGILLKMDQYIDLVIPRGGERLIRAVVEQSTIPVIKHYKGVCHLYIDEEADPAMALSILENGKFQRPGVCNALETLLIHEKIAPFLVEKILALFAKNECKGHFGDEKWRALDPAAGAVTEEMLCNEYLEKKISIVVVSSVEEAVEHINTHGSGHSDSIVTENGEKAAYFQDYVDSATVYWNASTRFTDGGEFGMGAEIGISTDKLHARGPMGLCELTTYKYKIYGNGQVRK